MGGARLAALLLEGDEGEFRLARNENTRAQSSHVREALGGVVVDGEAHVGGARRHDGC